MTSLATTLVILTFSMVVVEVSAKAVICFYTNWAQYRKGPAKFMPSNIDIKYCSHITYAHLMIDLKSHKLIQRQKNDHTLIKQLVALKANKPSLKIILSVGGWKHEELLPRFSNMAFSNKTRAVFINSAIAYMKKHHLDGLSIDWEYPTHRGTSVPEDKERYTSLLKEIKEAYQAENLDFTLSASVSAGPHIVNTAYEITNIVQYVDWVNVMAYALRGAWRPITGHHTLTSGDSPTVPDSLNAWVDGGMPKNKINLGLATYGRSFRLMDPENSGLGAPANGKGEKGKFTRSDGILSYYEICTKKWTKVTPWYDSDAGKPYASKGELWVGYETPDSLRQEVVELVNPNCLHGVAIWALGYDDFNGHFCKNGAFPLVKAAVEAIDFSECQGN